MTKQIALERGEEGFPLPPEKSVLVDLGQTSETDDSSLVVHVARRLVDIDDGLVVVDRVGDHVLLHRVSLINAVKGVELPEVGLGQSNHGAFVCNREPDIVELVVHRAGVLVDVHDALVGVERARDDRATIRICDGGCWIGDYPYLDRFAMEELLANDDEIWDSLLEEADDTTTGRNAKALVPVRRSRR